MKLIIDTEIANIFNKRNMDSIAKGKCAIFNAGLNAEKHNNGLYASNRCSQLIEMGYEFRANPMEIFGGISRFFQKLINDWLKLRAGKKEVTRDKLAIMKHNFWIRFSVFFNRLMFYRIRDHYYL